jgi:hypothetical protein
VGDRGAERALVLGALDIDMDPLMVAAQIGEGVDVLLADLAPLARPDLLAEQRLQPFNSLDLNRRHGPTLLVAQRL